MSDLGRDRDSGLTLPSLSTLTRSEYTEDTGRESGATMENNAAYDLGRTPMTVSSLTMSSFESSNQKVRKA